MTCLPSSVYAGSGCCSHHIGVDETKCTIDGRQVCKDDHISSCTCNPDYYDEEHLVDPKGHDETDPYPYSDSNNYEEPNNNSNQSHDITTESEDIENNENNEIIIDKNIKEGYLAISCTTLIGTLIIYITRIPPKKKSDSQ